MFRQRLWWLLFENMNKAIDELYFNCELELDLEQIEEALVFLDEARIDFKDLKTRVVGFDPIKNGPELPWVTATAKTSISSQGEMQQRRPHAVSWEV